MSVPGLRYLRPVDSRGRYLAHERVRVVEVIVEVIFASKDRPNVSDVRLHVERSGQEIPIGFGDVVSSGEVIVVSAARDVDVVSAPALLLEVVS